MGVNHQCGGLRRWAVKWCLRAVLAGAWLHLPGAHAAEPSPSPGPVVGADAWVSSDLMRHLLIIGQVPPARPVAVRVPSTLRADLNADAQVLCGRNFDGVWRVGLRELVLHRAAMADDGTVPRPKVAVSAQGLCATPATDTTIKALGADGQLRTTRIDLPKGVAQFTWQDLFYHDATDSYVAVGSEAFAIIPARELPERVRARAVSGTVAQGSIEGTHFSGFQCCAQLSPDGQTLYSIASIGDTNQSGYTAVVAVNTATAQYRRMYLPYSPLWYATKRAVSPFDKPLYDLGSGDEFPLQLSAADGGLYTVAFAEEEGAEAARFTMRINPMSGLVDKVPPQQVGHLAFISASGQYWVAPGPGDGDVVRGAAQGKEIDRTLSRVMAVAHAKSASHWPAAVAPAVQGVLAPMSARLGALDVPAKVAPALTSLARRVPSLRVLRDALADVSFTGQDPSTHAKVPVDISELLSYFQRVPMPQPARLRPVMDQAQAESPQAWAEFLKACDAFAQGQEGAQEQAFLQCVLVVI